jgi:hypothetical protein
MEAFAEVGFLALVGLAGTFGTAPRISIADPFYLRCANYRRLGL